MFYLGFGFGCVWKDPACDVVISSRPAVRQYCGSGGYGAVHGINICAQLPGWKPSAKNKLGWKWVSNSADVAKATSLRLAATIFGEVRARESECRWDRTHCAAARKSGWSSRATCV